MTKEQLLKKLGVEGKTQPITKEQQKAGVVAKIMKTHADDSEHDEEYWNCLVFLDSIHTDSYQRSLDRSHKNKICENFQMGHTNTPICSLRNDGKLRKNVPTIFVDDGQHTLVAIKEKGNPLHYEGKPVVVVSLAFDMTYARCK